MTKIEAYKAQMRDGLEDGRQVTYASETLRGVLVVVRDAATAGDGHKTLAAVDVLAAIPGIDPSPSLAGPELSIVLDALLVRDADLRLDPIESLDPESVAEALADIGRLAGEALALMEN